MIFVILLTPALFSAKIIDTKKLPKSGFLTPKNQISNICCCSKELYVAVQKMYLLLFNRNICCCSKEIFFAVQKIYLLLSKWKTWSEQLQSFSCSWPAGLRVVCSPPVAALQYHCCMDQPSRVKDRHWQRTIWRRQWEIDNNSSIQDLRRRFESVTQFWGWAALTTHVRLVALLLPLLLSNLSPLFDAGNNHCYLLPPPHICFLPCCC